MQTIILKRTIAFLASLVLLFALFSGGFAMAQSVQLRHNNGALIFGADGVTVYLLEKDKLYVFEDEAEFKTYGYSFDQVQTAYLADWDLTLVGKKKAAVWSLIKVKGNATVWLVRESDVIRAIPSLLVFNKWGFSLDKVVTVGSLEGYIVGNVLE